MGLAMVVFAVLNYVGLAWLVLSLVPKPAFLDRIVVSVTDKVMSIKLIKVGSTDVRLFTVLVAVSAATLASAAFNIYSANHEAVKSKNYYIKRCHADRDFWMSFFGLIVWCCIYRISNLVRENNELKSRKTD